MDEVLTAQFAQFVKQQNRKHNTLISEQAQPLVKETLRKSYPDVKKFYPIYSDTPDAWQADLTFFWEKAEDYIDLPKPPPKKKGKGKKVEKKKGRPRKNPIIPRLKIAVLCVINVNTRFAFAEVTEFTPQEIQDIEESKKSFATQQKLNVEVIKGSNKTPDKVLAAFKKILKDMKELKGRKLMDESGMKGYVTKVKGINFKVKTLYTDEGSEFKGSFHSFCKTAKIHHVMFTPSTGTKRRLGIVERFNRTLKDLVEQKRTEQTQLKKTQPSVKAVFQCSSRTQKHRP
jgi:hypothetical protein